MHSRREYRGIKLIEETEKSRSNFNQFAVG
jgi:hypothetical protein